MDSHKRSILKAITYRSIGLVVTMGAAYYVTQEALVSLSIAAIDTVVKIFGYYIHERLWERVKFGKGKVEYQI